MKKSPIGYMWMVAACLFMATPAMAERHEGARAGKHAGHHAKKFEQADANKDGFLTREEMEAAHKARLDKMFARMDENKDGKLSREEMKKGHEAMRAKWQARMQEHRQQSTGEPAHADDE